VCKNYRRNLQQRQALSIVAESENSAIAGKNICKQRFNYRVADQIPCMWRSKYYQSVLKINQQTFVVFTLIDGIARAESAHINLELA